MNAKHDALRNLAEKWMQKSQNGAARVDDAISTPDEQMRAIYVAQTYQHCAHELIDMLTFVHENPPAEEPDHVPAAPDNHKLDMVNHPPHYTRGPLLKIRRGTQFNAEIVEHRIECIEVIRHIRDMRLANAMKYAWRVAFGGKENDMEDIEKSIWYMRDYLEHPVS